MCNIYLCALKEFLKIFINKNFNIKRVVIVFKNILENLVAKCKTFKSLL